jgi:serine/threonine protein kinase
MSEVGQSVEPLDQKDDWGTVAGDLSENQSVADHPPDKPPSSGSRTVPNVRRPAAALLLDMPQELVDHPRYQVVRLLGKGGMGAVYVAEHRMMKRAVALKVIAEHLVSCSSAVERFRREVEAAARLSHPNIVTAFDAEQAGNCHFLVMELVDGVSLNRLVEQSGPFPVEQASEHIRQAALGLEHAHGHGMVHRDIKPHNLMLARGGQVKILDFGLTRFADDNQAEAPLTHWASLTGTPDYMPPEQAANAHAADIRADIYALGCTLYYLLAGRPPFPGGDAFEKIVAHMKHEPTPLPELRRDVPPELVQVVARMMAKNPEQRFQTPIEVARALSSFCPATAEGGAPESGPHHPRLSPSGERPISPSAMGSTPPPGGSFNLPCDPATSASRRPGSATEIVLPQETPPKSGSSRSSALTVALIVFVGFMAGGVFGLTELFRPASQEDGNQGAVHKKHHSSETLVSDKVSQAVPVEDVEEPPVEKREPVKVEPKPPAVPVEAPSTKQPKKTPKSRPEETITRTETPVPRGQVVLRSKDANVQVAIRRGALVVAMLRPNMGTKELQAGSYQVSVVGGPMSLQGMSSQITVVAGRVVAVDVRPDGIVSGDPATMPAPPPPPPDHPPPFPPPGPPGRKR